MIESQIINLKILGAIAVTTIEKGVGPVHFSRVFCTGRENNLLSCRYYTSQWCYYSYHAGVKCEGNVHSTLKYIKYYTIQFPVHMEMFI